MSRMRRKRFTSAAAARLISLAGGDVANVYDAVRVVAERLLEGVRTPPTDLSAIAAQLDVRDFVTGDLPYPGELKETSDGFRIVLASGLPEGRRRFTMAHELAHAVFQRTGRGWPRVGDELEELCDMLAAEMLMPSSQWSQHMNNTTVNLATVRSLARLFSVSLLAAAKRCSEFQPVLVFEANDKRITAGCRLIQRNIAIDRLPLDLGAAVGDALAGQRIEREVDVWCNRKCYPSIVEGMPTLLHKRAIFLLRERAG